MREFFNLQYIITFRPPLPFQCCNHVTVHGAYFNIEMGRGRFGYRQKSLFCSNVSTLCLIVACYGDQGRVHTTTEELKTKAFPWKTYQIFSVHTTRDKCKNATSIILGFYEENRKEFSKSSVSKMFSVRT